MNTKLRTNMQKAVVCEKVCGQFNNNICISLYKNCKTKIEKKNKKK